MSNLVEHAKRELEFANVEHDVRPSLIAAVEAFASFGHSGGSASICIPMLADLLQFKNIGPLTNNPDEWMDVAEFCGNANIWQNRRNSEAFSLDGGKTYYLLSEERCWIPFRIRRFIKMRDGIRPVYPLHKAVQA